MQKNRNKKVTKRKPAAKAEPARQKPERFLEAVGRRKTSTARVRIYPKTAGDFFINNKPLAGYFPAPELQQVASAALRAADVFGKFQVSAMVRGGGVASQAEAVRHGIARTLVIFNPELRKILKKAGFLTRDPRMRERKKFGLKRARRARQWRKR